MAHEEGETEDEQEVVTPCEGADLTLRSHQQKEKEKEKPTDAQVVIVEAPDVERT